MISHEIEHADFTHSVPSATSAFSHLEENNILECFLLSWKLLPNYFIHLICHKKSLIVLVFFNQEIIIIWDLEEDIRECAEKWEGML